MIRRNKPFNTLSRRRRRARTQHVKNLIRRERHRCRGLHYDDCDSENAEAIAAGWMCVSIPLKRTIHFALDRSLNRDGYIHILEAIEKSIIEFIHFMEGKYKFKLEVC
ncbi:hypothetical protein [Yersinia ruckeri]|uniref:hypothetical protein n=1 Tax=Yersinia ruckeri TaxID=29486 RepID=UPI0008FDA654|nr:hypothetical protein [Yersinia ruckeri]ELM3740152.1 hypothetical protein [Yersinia ruckeri]MCK8540878.1 hypothetical protein [Yersinia ruckeri]MCK8550781.1 hypothetical protein [Yersinia ruckeri]MCW6521388.1 hypothetical protein [Yersinia ruckeri]MCW6551271.1 hypothetical protein [Yersinia ruckeri]